MSSEPRPRAADVEDQEKRSREIADALRLFLTGANAGGIALVLGVIGGQTNGAGSTCWAAGAVGTFICGLAASAVSMMLAKWRAKMRREEARKGLDPLDKKFPRWKHSTIYEIAALLCLLGGAVAGLGWLLTADQ